MRQQLFNNAQMTSVGGMVKGSAAAIILLVLCIWISTMCEEQFDNLGMTSFRRVI